MIDLRLWFEGDILFCVDRASHAGGFDLLLPYADRRFFELTSSIPSSLKIKDGVGKYILRRAAEKKLPHETAFRKKVGFSVPLKAWLRQEKFRADLEAVLFGPNSGKYFDQQQLRRYWQSFLGGNDAIWRIIYSAYAFLIWEDGFFGAK
jgi:asparagine synthase (glutamine-hydrolysing)